MTDDLVLEYFHFGLTLINIPCTRRKLFSYQYISNSRLREKKFEDVVDSPTITIFAYTVKNFNLPSFDFIKAFTAVLS